MSKNSDADLDAEIAANAKQSFVFTNELIKSFCKEQKESGERINQSIEKWKNYDEAQGREYKGTQPISTEVINARFEECMSKLYKGPFLKD